MKKILKICTWVLGAVLLLAGILVAYLAFFLPNVGKAPDIKVDITPERVARGQYLATHVAVCIDCHSTRDWHQYSGPIIPGTEGKGGEKFDPAFGFPGTFYSRNITPYKLTAWTDGEIFRAVTSGVSRDGSALFPLMPYQHYGKVSREDIYNIIAYIRSLKPQTNEVPVSKPDFPVNLLMHLAPQKPTFVATPPDTDTVQYGGYLVMMAGCAECHSKVNKGAVVAGTEFGGGREFQFPAGTVRAPNITLHSTGIAYLDKAAFIHRFKQYTDSSYHSPALTPKDFNTPMPWTMYAGMKESDLAAIYAYLSTIKPIDNKVAKFSPAQP